MHETFFLDFFENKLKISLALILLPFLLYKKSLGFAFSPLDEQWLIEDNSAFLAKWASMKAAFSEPSAFIFYRPLFMVSLILDYHLGKLAPFIYHLTNLFLHSGSVLLVFKFLTQFMVKNKTAFTLALIFSVHPLMLHAVSWIPGRNDSLLCVFVLSSLIFLNTYLLKKDLKFLILHFLMFIVALIDCPLSYL